MKSESSWKTSDRLNREKETEKARQDEIKRARSEASPKPEKTEEKEEVKEAPVAAQEAPKLLTEKEMNALGAKIVKAELLGNDELAAKLKAKLAAAKEAREAAEESGETVQEVLLTRTDAKGNTRPVELPEASTETNRRKRNRRVATHGADGKRDRYFADDDGHSLREMFERERTGQEDEPEDSLARLAAAGRGLDRTNDEYDLDDALVDRAARKDGKRREREMGRAVAEHRRAQRALEGCRYVLLTLVKLLEKMV